MAYDEPIACTLSADELPKRLAEMSALGRDALLGIDQTGALRFRKDAATRSRLEAVIAAESVCCAFLAFDLKVENDVLELRISAPEGAEPLAFDLVDAFEAGARAA
jgi:hypothetical protein